MKKLLSILFFSLLINLLSAQVSKTINLTSAGTLSTLLTATEKTTITNLTVTGKIDARDVKCMRDAMTKLAVLDISSVSIMAYTGYDGTYPDGLYSMSYSDNEMCYNSFHYGDSNNENGKTSLTNIKLPNTLTSIKSSAFMGCTGLTSIIIPNPVYEIQQYAFRGCTGLTVINIPSNVGDLSSGVFDKCTGLTSITVDPTNLIFSSLDGVLLNKTKSTIIVFPLGKKGSYNIPTTVTSINSSQFANCTGLTSINIPNTVTSIGENAFSNCNGLTGNLTLPNSLISIGNYAFQNCSGLTGSLTLPNSLILIGYNAFQSCSGLTGNVTIGNSLTSFGDTGYGSNYVFNGCKGIISYLVDAANLNFSSKDGVLFNKDQSKIICFPGGKQGRYTVPNTVTTFNNELDLDGLTSLTIPSTVTGDCYVYLNDSTNLKYLEGPSKLFENFGNVNYFYSATLDTIKVNSGKLNSMGINGLNWFRTLRKLDLSQTLNTTLSTSAFKNLNQLEELILPSGLITIPYMSIAECVSLKLIQIPSTVTEVGMRAFENCRSMKSVNFAPNNQLKAIGNWAFYACHALNSITIPSGVTTIGDGAFWGCDYLKNVTIPSSVISIGDYGMEGCKAISSIQSEALEPPTVFANTFNEIDKSISIFVPQPSLAKYKTAFGWKDFYNVKAIGANNISSPDEINYSIRVVGKSIIISNVKDAQIVGYNIAGKNEFKTNNANSIEEFRVNNSGVYIICIGNHRTKIIVQ